ncbi:MAG: hypothetical protein V1810_01605 [Candidatus Beckwithbacteria bacterium]
MQIEQKGTPPYTLWTAETPIDYGGKSQPARFDEYLDMFYGLIDLTNCGEEAYKPEIHIKPIRVIDSKEKIILSMDNPEDVNLIKLVIQSLNAMDQIEVVKKPQPISPIINNYQV